MMVHHRHCRLPIADRRLKKITHFKTFAGLWLKLKTNNRESAIGNRQLL
jgi:hypothetical protein